MAWATIHSGHHHLKWDRDLEPALIAAPGDTVELHCLDASGGRIRQDSCHADVLDLDPERANPVTGPIYVDGVQPGDALIVDILDLDLGAWGWTALIPGFGLLADEFPDPYLHVSGYDADSVALTPEIRLPTRPFPGTVGVAPAAPGRHHLIPPRRVGGNLDSRDLVAGARLHLPVEVPGALLSVGDTHAAQGDGEVCGTAVETALSLRIRVDRVPAAAPPAPQIELPAGTAMAAPGEAGYRVTTGVGPDLMAAARDAVRAMIDCLERDYGLAPELAYCLCSTAADLRINEIVNQPNWVVSLRLPLGVFQ